MTTVTCYEMRVSQVFVCEKCGLELKVIKECQDARKSHGQCSCEHDENSECCNISCCGEDLKLKKA